MVAAVAALPPRWIVVGVAATDAVIGPDSVGTFAGFGADLVVRLSREATGPPVELPLCAVMAGWMPGRAQRAAHAEVRVVAASHDSDAALARGRQLRDE